MMRYQRGGLIMYAIGAVVVLSMLAGAVIWANHFISVTWEEPAYKRGSDDQRVKDQDIVDQLKKQITDAQEDTRLCREVADKQTLKINRLQEIAANNAEHARAVLAQAKRDAEIAAPRIIDLQKRAAAQPKLMVCEEELGKAKEVLRDALRQRRAVPALPAAK